MLKYFPASNSAKDLNSNLIFGDDYTQVREYFQNRDNFDLKLTWQLKPTATIWGKFGMMDNEGSGDSFILGFDEPSIGDTRVYLGDGRAPPGRWARRRSSTPTSASAGRTRP